MTRRADPPRHPQSVADVAAVITRLEHGVNPVWYRDAECAGMNPERWFPERGGETATAMAVCARCPVRQDCLAVSVKERERFGIWGGYSDRGRRRLIRTILSERPELLPTEQQEAAKCGTISGYSRHLRNGEPTCLSCREAKQAASVTYRQAVADRRGSERRAKLRVIEGVA